MSLVDEADLLALMEKMPDAYTAKGSGGAGGHKDRLKTEKKPRKLRKRSGSIRQRLQPKKTKVTKIASGFLGVVVLIARAGGRQRLLRFRKTEAQKKQSRKATP